MKATIAPIRRISLKPLTKATLAAWTTPSAARRRTQPRRACRPEATASASPAVRSAAARQLRVDAGLEDGAEAATPVAIPTWRKVVLIPSPFPHSRPGRRRSPPGRSRVGDADPDAGDEEAGSRPSPESARARASAAADADHAEADPEQDRIGSGGRACRRSARRRRRGRSAAGSAGRPPAARSRARPACRSSGRGTSRTSPPRGRRRPLRRR
jgi:hypothetical protein